MNIEVLAIVTLGPIMMIVRYKGAYYLTHFVSGIDMTRMWKIQKPQTLPGILEALQEKSWTAASLKGDIVAEADPSHLTGRWMADTTGHGMFIARLFNDSFDHV